MKNYKVKIKDSDKAETIKARSELEARVKFCEKKTLMYRIFANKLEIIQGGKK